jgi:membrane fusion protein
MNLREHALTQPSNSLYRQQAINAHFAHQYGEVIMLPKTKQLLLAVFITVWVIVAGVFVSTQPFAQTVEVKGWISTQTEPVSIRAKESTGILNKVWVKNGDRVSRNQPLLTVYRQSHTLLGNQLFQEKQNSLTSAFNISTDEFTQRVETFKSAIEGLQQQLSLLAAQRNILLKQVDNAKQKEATLANQTQHLTALAEQSLVPKTQSEQVLIRWLDAQNNHQALTYQLVQLEEQSLLLDKQIQQNNEQIENTHLQTKQAQLQHKNALAELQQAGQYILRAPIAGKVDNLFSNVGDTLNLNQQVLQVLPQQQVLKSRLVVPASEAGFLLPTQKVKVKVDGFPYQQYGAIEATISHISKQVMLPNDTSNLPVRLNAPIYLVELELTKSDMTAKGKTWPLSAGMTISASIKIDEPSIIQWMLGPLFNALGGQK